MTRSSLSSLSARLTALVISLSVATPLSVAHAATPAPEFDAPSGLAPQSQIGSTLPPQAFRGPTAAMPPIR